MLIVIGIIAFLFSAILFALGGTPNNARISATKTLLKQLDAAVQDRVEGFNNHSFRSDATQLKAIPGVTSGQTTCEIAARKFRYQQMLPQRVADAKNRPISGPLTFYSPLHSKVVDSMGMDLPLSNPDMLYLFLTEGPTYGAAPLNLSDIDPVFIADSDNSGYLNFVDSWGNGIRFYNAPTRLVRSVNPGSDIDLTVPAQQEAWTVANALVFSLEPPTSGSSIVATDFRHRMNIDPNDPIGDVANDPVFGPLFNENNFYGANTYFTPLLVSAGPDEQLGLYEPTVGGSNRLGKVETAGQAYDNLTNRQRGGP